MTAAQHTEQSPASMPLTAVHIALGVALVTVNLAAGLYGAWAWWQWRDSPGFWPLLRAGQVLVVIEAAIGVALTIAGEDLPELHLVYGLTPLGVAFVAEQLRIVAAQAELDHRDLEGRAAIEGLPESERRELIRAILRREVGVMAASALIVALLGIRASGWL
jgi:hypothetical protein